MTMDDLFESVEMPVIIIDKELEDVRDESIREK